jgi:hypothetical protein
MIVVGAPYLEARNVTAMVHGEPGAYAEIPQAPMPPAGWAWEMTAGVTASGATASGF